MRAGRLDRRITLQRKSLTQLPSGEPLESWVTLVENRPASYTPIVGSESQGPEQARARQQVEFRVRWSTELANLTPLDRIVYPANAATDSPSQAWTFYDILAVNEVGHHEALQIISARQADVSP